MYVPMPPTPPPTGADPLRIESGALGPAIPKSGLLASTSATKIATALAVRRSTVNLLQWHPATVTGTLRARQGAGGLAGRMVALQGLGSHGWHTLAVTRTGRGGVF